MSETNIPIRMLRAPHAARYCGLSVRDLYELLHRGDYPAPLRPKGGERSRPSWDVRDLDAWIDARKVAQRVGPAPAEVRAEVRRLLRGA